MTLWNDKRTPPGHFTETAQHPASNGNWGQPTAWDRTATAMHAPSSAPSSPSSATTTDKRATRGEKMLRKAIPVRSDQQIVTKRGERMRSKPVK